MYNFAPCDLTINGKLMIMPWTLLGANFVKVFHSLAYETLKVKGKTKNRFSLWNDVKRLHIWVLKITFLEFNCFSCQQPYNPNKFYFLLYLDVCNNLIHIFYFNLIHISTLLLTYIGWGVVVVVVGRLVGPRGSSKPPFGQKITLFIPC